PPAISPLSLPDALPICDRARDAGRRLLRRAHARRAGGCGGAARAAPAVRRGGRRARGALPGAGGRRERARLSDGAFAALERHFPAREIVELLITVGYYMMVARLLESTAVDIDPPARPPVVRSSLCRAD